MLTSFVDGYLSSFSQSLRGEAGDLWVLDCLKHPSFALRLESWLCLKFQVWNPSSPSTLKILIQLILKYTFVIENFDAN